MNRVFLYKKYDSLAENKVFNVSNIKKDGSGVRTITRPKKPKTLQFPPNKELKLVSNNLESYLLAFELLELDEERFQEQLEYMESLQEEGIIN